jgi:hypothetical protein
VLLQQRQSGGRTGWPHSKQVSDSAYLADWHSRHSQASNYIVELQIRGRVATTLAIVSRDWVERPSRLPVPKSLNGYADTGRGFARSHYFFHKSTMTPGAHCVSSSKPTLEHCRHSTKVADTSFPPFQNPRFFVWRPATVGTREHEGSVILSGPPGSRSQHLESVARMFRDVAQCPDLLAGQRGMSTNVRCSPLTFEFVARQLARSRLVSSSSHYSISRDRW